MADLGIFQRMTITQVATELAIHPFDLIRVLVASDSLPRDLLFDAAQLPRIRADGGIETWWTSDARDNDDGTPQGLLRSLCSQLVERAVVGSNSTRLDNLLRGLDTDDQLVVRSLVQALMQSGLVQSWNTATGLHISVVEGREYAIADIAEGGELPPDLASIVS